MPHSSNAKARRTYRRRVERGAAVMPEQHQQLQPYYDRQDEMQFMPGILDFMMAFDQVWRQMQYSTQREVQRQRLVATIEAERQRQLQELDTPDIAGLIEESRCCQLLKAIDGVSLTTDDGQPDVITLDCSSEHIRAIMPCGHVIGPQSLYDYCVCSVLPDGKFDIVCPVRGCNAIWNYDTVRHVACLSSAETEDLETRLTLNYLRHTEVSYQQCKGCGSWCCRADPDKISCQTVSCPVCSEREGHDYSFCWGCLEESNDDLVNGGCVCENVTHEVQLQLSECPEKQLIAGGVMCPSVRACPRCFSLMEHTEQCQHVMCKSCHYWFCFICLHPSGFHGDNVESRDACRRAFGPLACREVAPRQTKLIRSAA